jgi:hypothetical protein
MTTKIIISIVIMLMIFLAWCIVIGVVSLKKYEDSTTALVLFYISSFGFSILFVFSLAMMQYLHKDKVNFHYSYKVYYIIY